MFSNICLPLAIGLILCGGVWTFENGEYCANLGKEEVACFDSKKLGYCMKIGDSWYGATIAECPDSLFCDATYKGCSMSDNNLPAASACEFGDLQKHSDCQKYYYCSQNVWAVGTCPIGHYDDNYKRCVLGDCVN